MDREIVLSSYSVKGQGNNTPQNFTTKFNRPIILDSNSQYAVGLNRIINMSFTWFNVNPSYANQLIKYSSDSGSTFHDITFPEGVWNYTDFNTHIKDITKIVKDGANNNDRSSFYDWYNAYLEVQFQLQVLADGKGLMEKGLRMQYIQQLSMEPIH